MKRTQFRSLLLGGLAGILATGALAQIPIDYRERWSQSDQELTMRIAAGGALGHVYVGPARPNIDNSVGQYYRYTPTGSKVISRTISSVERFLEPQPDGSVFSVGPVFDSLAGSPFKYDSFRFIIPAGAVWAMDGIFFSANYKTYKAGFAKGQPVCFITTEDDGLPDDVNLASGFAIRFPTKPAQDVRRIVDPGFSFIPGTNLNVNLPMVFSMSSSGTYVVFGASGDTNYVWTVNDLGFNVSVVPTTLPVPNDMVAIPVSSALKRRGQNIVVAYDDNLRMLSPTLSTVWSISTPGLRNIKVTLVPGAGILAERISGTQRSYQLVRTDGTVIQTVTPPAAIFGSNPIVKADSTGDIHVSGHSNHRLYRANGEVLDWSIGNLVLDDWGNAYTWVSGFDPDFETDFVEFQCTSNLRSLTPAVPTYKGGDRVRFTAELLFPANLRHKIASVTVTGPVASPVPTELDFGTNRIAQLRIPTLPVSEPATLTVTVTFGGRSVSGNVEIVP